MESVTELERWEVQAIRALSRHREQLDVLCATRRRLVGADDELRLKDLVALREATEKVLKDLEVQREK
jgi:hypothetical protein